MKTGNIGVTTENIFPIIKKFLYSDHEIFLRELVSNAVDATQKLKTYALKGDFKGELGDDVYTELEEKVTAENAKSAAKNVSKRILNPCNNRWFWYFSYLCRWKCWFKSLCGYHHKCQDTKAFSL